MNRINIRKTLYVWTAFVVVGGLSSCNFLSIEDYVDKELAIDSIFTQKRYLEAYMWGASSYFPDEGALTYNPYTPGPMATDEAFCEFPTGSFQGMAYVIGQRNESNLGSLNQWRNSYQIIRQCNNILTRMDETRDLTITERMRITAYTRFFRAYAYYIILMNHGPVLLLGDEVVKNNEEIAYYDRPRDLYDDCVEYICTELEEAAKNLPYSPQSVADFGTPTKGAALGLVARLRLQHASDLYNGGNSARMYFGSWRRKTDGQHYIQQNYDPRRWAVAAAAAKRLIDMKDEAGVKLYELHKVDADINTPELSKNTPDPNYLNNWPDGAAGIDPFHSYADMFTNETNMAVNKEFVWARFSPSITDRDTRHSLPILNESGYNGMCVTQKVVDAYEMSDGSPSNNPSEDLVLSTEFTTNTINDLYTGYRLNADVHKMYVNREARFYASIGFSQAFWYMLSTTEEAKKNLTVKYYSNESNGRDGSRAADGYPKTGYVLRKYVHPIDTWGGISARHLSKAFPIIRYAEILLIYAEALNQLGGESFTINIDDVPQSFSRNTEEIKWAYNQVRYRAGLPGLTDADLVNAENVMAKIKRERMVEFLYEGHRYFDVRRWGDYEQSESEPMVGMNTNGTRDAYYQRVVVQSTRVAQRVVSRKMIFLPLNLTELKRLPSFDQNPGW